MPYGNDALGYAAYSFAHLNYLAIIVSAIAYMAFGFLWYSPLLVGKPWMKLMGMDKMSHEQMKKMQKEAGPAYMLTMVTSLLLAFILDWAILPNLAYLSLGMAVLTVALMWLAFTFFYAINVSAFMKQPYALAAINSGNQLFGVIIMTFILRSWA